MGAKHKVPGAAAACRTEGIRTARTLADFV